MDAVFQDFRNAHYSGNGALLASTLSPVPSSQDPDRLEAFYQQTNPFEVNADIKYYVSKDNSALKIKAAEANCWSDVYITYWKSLSAILSSQKRGSGGDQAKVYEAWKELANALIRGYTNGGFEAWTVPCLYIVAKWLRTFAIRADRASNGQGRGHLKAGDLEDGFASELGNNERLEDAARVINRIFTLCISDRYVDSIQNAYTQKNLDFSVVCADEHIELH